MKEYLFSLHLLDDKHLVVLAHVVSHQFGLQLRKHLYLGHFVDHHLLVDQNEYGHLQTLFDCSQHRLLQEDLVLLHVLVDLL